MTKSEFLAQFDSEIMVTPEQKKELIPTNPEIATQFGVEIFRWLNKIVVKHGGKFFTRWAPEFALTTTWN